MYAYCNPGVTWPYQSQRRTIVLEWMPGSRSCLHSEGTGPAALITGVGPFTYEQRSSTNMERSPIVLCGIVALMNAIAIGFQGNGNLLWSGMFLGLVLGAACFCLGFQRGFEASTFR